MIALAAAREIADRIGSERARQGLIRAADVQRGRRGAFEEAALLAEILKARGYATACIGKWGLGPMDSAGSPLKQGFDRFFGYNCQRHAHSYFPTYLYRDDQRFTLDGNETYADVAQIEALFDTLARHPATAHTPAAPHSRNSAIRGRWSDMRCQMRPVGAMA